MKNYQNNSSKNYRKLILTALSIISLYATSVQASYFTLNDLSLMMSSIKNDQIFFTESKSKHFLQKPLIITGRLYYNSRKFLQKNIETPFRKIYTIRKNKVTFTNEELLSRKLKINDHPVIHASLKALHSTMSGDYKKLKSNYKIILNGNSKEWELILLPRNKKASKYTKNITITGDHTFIKNVVTNETNGDSSIISMVK